MKQFQEDLRNGMTIEKALHKHQLTFQEAFEKCDNGSCRGNGEYHHIYLDKKTGKYHVKKSILGKETHFGTFKDLDEAVKFRDELERNGWRKPK